MVKTCTRYSVLCFATILLSSCGPMEVKNLNDPDLQSFISTPGKTEEITGSLINQWFQITQEYSSLGLPLLVAADAGTCSHGITRRDGSEPRAEFDNHPSCSNAYQSENYYKKLYAVLTLANAVLSLTENKDYRSGTFSTAMIRAVAWFVQGISLGYLGLIYDKAFLVTHETDLTAELETSPYTDIIHSAVESLDQAISISNQNSFTLPTEWLPGESWNNTEFARLASSFAARLLVYSARNKTQDGNTDWSRVYAYAKNGIRKDFAPLADDKKWYSLYHTYSSFLGWLQTDMYVIHLMDPHMPARFPKSGNFADLPDYGKATSSDARLESDYQYMSSCPFNPLRGYYHFSSYRYKRLDTYLSTRTEPMPEFRKAENDCLMAEAAVHTGRIQEAADIMNASARVTRGKLPPLQADKDAILEAIHYERMVELMISGFGIQYFQMRKEDKLQPGTLLHYPIPGSELQIMGMRYYTFGGTTGIPGQDYSNGGW